MIRRVLRGCFNPKFTSSHTTNKPIAKENTQALSEEFLEDYKLGLINQKQKKLLISNEYMRKALQQLDNEGLRNSDTYILVLKKMVQNLEVLRQHEDVNKAIKQIIQINIKNDNNVAVLYNEYNSLFIHTLHTDIKQAILLGKSLLTDTEKKLPALYKKSFTFYLGTAYLLFGSYGDAKRRFHESLKMDPNPILKGRILNNLALACWWHMYPYAIRLQDLKSSEEEEEKFREQHYPEDKVETEFKDCKTLFKSAILEFQNVKNTEDKERGMEIEKLMAITNLTKADIAKYSPKQRGLFRSKESAACLMNIAQLIFCTAPELKDQAVFWFKLALYHSAEVDPLHHNRCLVMLAYLCAMDGDVERADRLFKLVLEKEKDSNSYNKSTAMFRYGAILKEIGRRQQGDRWIKASIDFSKSLPYWYKRMIHVILPDKEM